MKIRRWSVGVLAATLLVPGLAACKTDTAEPGATTSATAPAIPADAKEALLASIKEISNGNFRFAMVGNEFTGGGLIHLPSKSGQLTMKFGDDSAEMSMGMDIVFIEPESWVKVEIGGMMLESMPGMEKLNNGKYQHLDQSRVKDMENLQFDMSEVDPAGSELLIKGITEVEKTGEGTYTGKIDISGATEAAALDVDVIKALGAQAKSLPFTAKLDPQGRLTEFVIVVPAAGEAKAHEIKVTYSDYGNATAVQQPPADQVVEASDEVYEMFK